MQLSANRLPRHSESRRGRRVALVFLLLVSAYLLFEAFLTTTVHFVIGKERLGWSAGGTSPAGDSIVDPLIYSIHVAALWFGGLGAAWVAFVAYRGELAWKPWVLAGVVGIGLGATPIVWESRGYGVDYEGLGRLIGLGLLVLWAITLLVSAIWIRQSRRRWLIRGHGDCFLHVWRPRIRYQWALGILAAMLMVVWFVVGAPIDEMDGWDPNRVDAGFNTPVKHLSGASLPLLVAAAPLAGLLLMPMGHVARRFLSWELTLLQLIVYGVHSMSWFQALVADGALQAGLVLALDAYWAYAWWVAVRPALGLPLIIAHPQVEVIAAKQVREITDSRLFATGEQQQGQR